MTDVTNPTPAISPAAPADDGYDAAMDAVMNAPTGYARVKALEELERIAVTRATSAEVAPQAQDPDAFPPPVSALAYEFVTPPGVEPMTEVETGEVRSALFSEGIPREFVGQGYRNLAHLHQTGALASEEAYVAACGKCRENVEKMHGADAPAMIRDGITYLEALAKKHPSLDAAVTAALADPYLLTNAATLHRQQARRR